MRLIASSLTDQSWSRARQLVDRAAVRGSIVAVGERFNEAGRRRYRINVFSDDRSLRLNRLGFYSPPLAA